MREVAAAVLGLALLVSQAAVAFGPGEGAEWAAAFVAEVDHPLVVPPEELVRYELLLGDALAQAGIARLTPQPLLIVDRSADIQALLLVWVDDAARLHFVGSVPVSTGEPGRYEYFETPLGVFRHLPGNPDFRAEGTPNQYGILGYGPHGTRIYDFGWQVARRGWGSGGASLMRLQLHATDPSILEPRLGTRQSKGCIRVPLSFIHFLERHRVLDADYQSALDQGMKLYLWDLPPEGPAPGRYLVVVDSGRIGRPGWAALPTR